MGSPNGSLKITIQIEELVCSKDARAEFVSGKLDVPNQAFLLRSQFGSKTMLSKVSCRQKVIVSLDIPGPRENTTRVPEGSHPMTR